MPVPKDEKEGCLCRACLSAEIERRAAEMALTHAPENSEGKTSRLKGYNSGRGIEPPKTSDAV